MSPDHQLPWLTPTDDPMHYVRRHLRHPDSITPMQICGAHQSWVVVMDGDPSKDFQRCYNNLPNPTGKIWALNPTTADHLLLPHPACDVFIDFPIGDRGRLRSRVVKVAMSSPPDDAAAIFVALLDCRWVAYARPGDAEWTVPLLTPGLSCLEDVVYCGGSWYGLTYSSHLVSLSLGGPGPDAVVRLLGLGVPENVRPNGLIKASDEFVRNRYLLQSRGRIMVVIARAIRVEDGSLVRTNGFSVFELMVHETGSPSWREVESLGDQVMFVSNKYSVSLPADELTGDEVFRRKNCIYFTDDLTFHKDDERPLRDMGVFCMEKGTIEFFSAGEGQIKSVPLFFHLFQKAEFLLRGVDCPWDIKQFDFPPL